MYFSNQKVHIMYYIIVVLLGAVTGKIANWANYRLPDKQKIISLDFFRKKYKENYLIIVANIIINILVISKCGIDSTIIGNLELIKYLLLTPMLLSVFVIDYKTQTIPNRLNLTIFETGLIIAFLSSWSNIAITIEMLQGMLVGGIIFLIITLISKIILGKDSVGLGDVKLITALGLYLGKANIVVVSIISFIIAAIVSIILLILKKKKSNEYLSFGPFIVIASLIGILVENNEILNILVKIFTLGLI